MTTTTDQTPHTSHAPYSYDLLRECKDTKARAGVLHTPHGDIHTPIFMPVGTQASVKALTSEQVEEAGAEIILGNTYHLYLRPGLDILQKAGGLRHFMKWPKAMLTDSGGFQVWSLSPIRKMTREGVEFRSHIDGSKIMFTPESVMRSQQIIGADIMMAFDECTAYPSTPKQLRDSLDITLHWHERAVEYLSKNDSIYGYPQALFGIVQGGTEFDLRCEAIEKLKSYDLPGYALGGLSVGEPIPMIYDMVERCAPLLQKHKPRYVMGMGTPQDLLELVSRGIDMFDCVIPTRNARNGMVWTWDGVLHYKAARYAQDLDTPLDPKCGCPVCKKYSRAYLRHLFKAGEITALHLSSYHNVWFFLELMREARKHILAGDFSSWSQNLLKLWAVQKNENKNL